MILIGWLDVLGDVLVPVLWPYNRFFEVSLCLRCLKLFEACAELGQIAKLSPGVLVGYAELVQFEKSFAKSGFVSAATPSKFEVFRTVLCLSDESSADVCLG